MGSLKFVVSYTDIQISVVCGRIIWYVGRFISLCISIRHVFVTSYDGLGWHMKSRNINPPQTMMISHHYLHVPCSFLFAYVIYIYIYILWFLLVGFWPEGRTLPLLQWPRTGGTLPLWRHPKGCGIPGVLCFSRVYL